MALYSILVDFSPTLYCLPKPLFLYGSMVLLSALVQYNGGFLPGIILFVWLGLNQVISEMVVDGGGYFSPACIDGVYTCLCYYRPIQHIAVPRVIRYNTYTLQ